MEGKQEYTSLLYIPSVAPFDLWHRDQRRGLSLYVQRVFIMDDAEQFMPNYLRFVRGLIDSNDLPLNVSREILQDSAVTRSLRSALTKRVLQMLEKLANNDAEKYQTFWQQFGLVLKEGRARTAQCGTDRQTAAFCQHEGRHLRADRFRRIMYPAWRKVRRKFTTSPQTAMRLRKQPAPGTVP